MNKVTMKKFTTEEIRDLLNRVMREEISFSRMVEVINERAVDVREPKFKKGDKVRIKEGISSKTHDNIDPVFVEEMDDLIGKTMTVDRYTYLNNYVKCEETEYSFLEDWLEPHEEPKKGDLAIFWDVSKKNAIIKMYYRSNKGVRYRMHQDIQGLSWKNAIKFESKEQYEKLIKGEI